MRKPEKGLRCFFRCLVSEGNGGGRFCRRIRRQNQRRVRQNVAFYSLQCVNCQESTKRCEGKYKGTEGKGKHFCGTMYMCENQKCSVNMERMRGEKQIRSLEMSKQR